jgi:hypothetical protein
METHDVFLSHSSVDAPWVHRLAADLQRYGVRVWLDREALLPGDAFVPALERALAQSRVVALIVSSESVASRWVQEEYQRAIGLGKRIIPVVFREAEMPGFLQSRHRVDFRDPRQYDVNVQQLVCGIKGTLPTAAASRPVGARFELAITLREYRGQWQHRFSLPQEPDFLRQDLQCPDPALLFGYPADLIEGDYLFELLFGSDLQTSRAILGAAFGGVPSAEPTSQQLRLHLCSDDTRLSTLPWARLAYNGARLAEGGWTVELHPAGNRGFPALPPHLCFFPGKIVLASTHDGVPQAAAHSRDLRRFVQRTWPRAQMPVLVHTPAELSAALAAGSTRLLYYYGPAATEGLLLDGSADCIPWSTLADFLRRAGSVSVVLLNLLGEASQAVLPQMQQLLVKDGAVLVQYNPLIQAAEAALTAQRWLQHVFAAPQRLDPVQALYLHGHGQRVAWTGYSSWQAIAPRVLTMPDLINLLLDRWRQRAALLQAKKDFDTYKTRRIYHVVALGTPGCRVLEFPETVSQHLNHTKDEREVILFHAFPISAAPLALDDLVQQNLRLSPRQTVLEALLPPDYRSGQAAWFLVLGWLIQFPLPPGSTLLRSIAEWCRSTLLQELLRLGQEVNVRVLSVVAVEAPDAEAATALEAEIEALMDEMNDEATFHWDMLERLAGVQRQDLVRYFQDKELCDCADRDRPEFPALLLAGRREMPFDEAVATLRRATPHNWESLFLELSAMRDAGAWPPAVYRPDFWETHDGR